MNEPMMTLCQGRDGNWHRDFATPWERTPTMEAKAAPAPTGAPAATWLRRVISAG